jgi:hypothetical protein
MRSRTPVALTRTVVMFVEPIVLDTECQLAITTDTIRYALVQPRDADKCAMDILWNSETSCTDSILGLRLSKTLKQKLVNQSRP